jgi:acetyl esterase/lipase
MRSISTLLIICISFIAASQTTYLTDKDIRYYPDSLYKDAYLKEMCTLDVYYPQGVKDAPAVVWFHGGGITEGAKEIPKALMEKGFIIIGVGYRLSPKVKAPAYIEDAAAAVAWAFKNAARYNGNPKLVFVSGHSAGGYLGMMVTLDKKYLSRYAINANDVAELIPFSGQAITHFTVRKERGIADVQPVIDNYAPLFFVRADAPPMLLITGDREMELLGRYEENAYLARMMKLAGHKRTRLFELQGYDHGGMAQPAFPLLVKEVNNRKKEILDQKN